MPSRQGAFQGDKKTMMVAPQVHSKLTDIKVIMEKRRGREVTYTEVLEYLTERWVETGGDEGI